MQSCGRNAPRLGLSTTASFHTPHFQHAMLSHSPAVMHTALLLSRCSTRPGVCVNDACLVTSDMHAQGGVNCINVRDGPGVTRPECVSAGADGSCIVWDLATFRRRTTLLANTSFKAVVYHPDGSQLVTVGEFVVKTRMHIS